MEPILGRRRLGLIVLALAACSTEPVVMEMLPTAGAPMKSCVALSSSFAFEHTTLSASRVVSAGTLKVGGVNVGEHCQVLGKMHERVSPVDGQTYAIGFEMRLPRSWNGRFFYQGNGGLDGFIPPAVGAVSGGGPVTHALQQGFAVISSDAGHTAKQLPLFGLDPQARLDYGYQAVAKLTPMAKAMIEAAYGRPPARSYIGGSSNGGRHAMVAATRLPHEYDGFLAIAPGFNLPKAAVAQLYGAQQYARIATDPKNLETAFTADERRLVASRILGACDALDGAADGLVEDVTGCRTAFNLARDVPTCAAARDSTCLTAAQKSAIGNVFAGARNSRGDALYARFPFEPGITYNDWADWEFKYSVTNRDPVAVGFVFQVPPADLGVQSDLLKFALEFNLDSDAARIYASNATYTQSAMSFMTPPNVTKLDALRQRGARLLVVHGNADPVFSVDDSAAWYDAVRAAYGADAQRFVRLFRVPGMGHSRGGPATDQFDALGALVDWVEHGRAPDRIIATARGAGNAGGLNPDVPVTWAPNRTRPLCPYPAIARYIGSGSIEVAESFTCR
jgi:pimeloyl-ACP methyl ester carboxylesterase